MARRSSVAAEARRRATVERYAERRAALKQRIRTEAPGSAEQRDAVRRLARLPRDASPVRLRNRCALTGRPRGVYRKFGLGRNKLRDLALKGEVPGVIKASW